jgi:hypothetical protein
MRPTKRALCLASLAERTAGRWGVCGIFEHFSDFEFFLLPNRIHARPSATLRGRKPLGTLHRIMEPQIEARLIEAICERISWYSTALMLIDSQVVNPLTDVFIGCGTFIRVDDRYGILTAHHVAKEISAPCRLGLVLRLETAESFAIESDHFTIWDLAVSNPYEVGHDLAFIEFYEPDVSTIKARKQFVNLSLDSQTVLPNPPGLNQGGWFIWGAAAYRNTIEPPERGLQPIIGLHGLCGPGLAVKEKVEDEHDYIEIQVKYGEGYETPETFKGYSGGGLWQVRIEGIGTDSPTPTDWIYSGVIIVQSDVVDQERLLTCHGRRSVYEYVLNKIRTRRA